jgi:hypothetical protein
MQIQRLQDFLHPIRGDTTARRSSSTGSRLCGHAGCCGCSQAPCVSTVGLFWWATASRSPSGAGRCQQSTYCISNRNPPPSPSTSWALLAGRQFARPRGSERVRGATRPGAGCDPPLLATTLLRVVLSSCKRRANHMPSGVKDEIARSSMAASDRGTRWGSTGGQ